MPLLLEIIFIRNYSIKKIGIIFKRQIVSNHFKRLTLWHKQKASPVRFLTEALNLIHQQIKISADHQDQFQTTPKIILR